MKNLFYIVMYNDLAGSGEDKYLECIVKSKKDFKKWLSIRNKERKKQGEMRETPDYYDLIPVNLFS